MGSRHLSPLPLARLLLVLAAVAVGLAAGLASEGRVSLWEVDPARAVDSETVLARGFPHAWLVVHPQPSVPSLTPRRIARANLLQSTFFWLACSAVVVCAGLATVRKLRRSTGRLSYDTTVVRAFVAVVTAACAASYAYLFVGIVDFWPLSASTAVALLSFLLLIRSKADLRRRWLLIVMLLAALLLVAFTLDAELPAILSIVGLFVAASLAVALALLYSLTSTSTPSST
jgi:hypothetical protein